MKQKLTQWHDGSVKPSISGVYEVRDGDGSSFRLNESSYAYFNTKTKRWTTATIELMAHQRYVGSGKPSQNKQWRGLAEKPD